MFCPKHPKLEMTDSGRCYEGEPIMHCPACIKSQREKLAVLRAIPFKNSRRHKQVVLPPVMMPERWP